MVGDLSPSRPPSVSWSTDLARYSRCNLVEQIACSNPFGALCALASILLPSILGFRCLPRQRQQETNAQIRHLHLAPVVECCMGDGKKQALHSVSRFTTHTRIHYYPGMVVRLLYCIVKMQCIIESMVLLCNTLCTGSYGEHRVVGVMSAHAHAQVMPATWTCSLKPQPCLQLVRVSAREALVRMYVCVCVLGV